MELQQQQQQLISMEGFDGSTVRVLVSRLINVVLALLAVILVFVHTGIHLLGPFLNTRYATPIVTYVHSVSRYCFWRRLGTVCLSVCTKSQNYWSEIDVTW